jgi:K+-transporting ATPase ATPase A chain
MSSIIDILICLAVVAVCIKPLGWYMARVYMGRSVWLTRFIEPVEQAMYRLCGIDPDTEMSWRGYAVAVLMLGLFGFVMLFGVFSMQHLLPLNPRNYDSLTPDLAFNAAISFITNTNWQSYSGEGSLSYFSQMMLVVQQYFSAATGMAVAVALFRALGRKQAATIGNAWVDITRGILYILLPMSMLFAFILTSQGVIQNFSDYTQYHPLEEVANTGYEIAQGPVASLVAIKMLGSNGGGFFNANGAHPFENPTTLSNFLELISILLIPAAFVYVFGIMAGDRRQSWAVLAAMAVIFLPMCALTIISEKGVSPRFEKAVIDQSDGNMEGKEVRFGVATSALWATATTATSNGSVNAMHDSFLPLGGLVPILMMQFGEVIFGGVGSGMYGMLMFVLLTVFIGGLMVGRTPEYLGKKLGPYEIKMASLVILIPAALVLIGTALAVSIEAGTSAIANSGAQGFSEILYAFTSSANNNGSAFAGLSANSTFYNIALGIVMFIGRYWVIVPVLAIAGSLAPKNTVPVSAGTMPTHTPLFAAMLVGVIVLIGVLTYIPALALGPVAEHMRLIHGVKP